VTTHALQNQIVHTRYLNGATMQDLRPIDFDS